MIGTDGERESAKSVLPSRLDNDDDDDDDTSWRLLQAYGTETRIDKKPVG